MCSGSCSPLGGVSGGKPYLTSVRNLKTILIISLRLQEKYNYVFMMALRFQFENNKKINNNNNNLIYR